MRARHLTPILKNAATQSPVVTVTGPRQSGKTTLVRAVFPGHEYVSLEDPDHRAFATEDPREFLDQFRGGVILDEVQRVPQVFAYLQGYVDADPVPGRYILTGSQNFLLLEAVGQSLAGRVSVLHLMLFSRSELIGARGLSWERIGRSVPRAGGPREPDLLELLHSGFYPRVHEPGVDPSRWLADYDRTYVDRDVRSVVNVGDLALFRDFVRLCAGRNGELLNLTSLGNDAGVSHETARRWISVLETSFLVVRLRPYYRNFGKRLIKSPKLYFLDTGLLCHLLRIRSPEELRAHSSRGAVFESFVLSELYKKALHTGREPDVYFWRDSTGHEVDFLLDLGDEQIPVEAKSGKTFASDFMKGVIQWRELAGVPEGPAAVIHGGDRSFRRKGVVALSWADL